MEEKKNTNEDASSKTKTKLFKSETPQPNTLQK